MRGHLRREGLREVMTPPVQDAVAIEPWIEPVAAGTGWLHTSPELAMKRLLAAGGGPMFQITHVARAAERGAWHREQFVLLEWYRTASPDRAADPRGPMADVEQLVAHVFDAVAPWAAGSVSAPRSWSTIGFLDAVLVTGGPRLRGDEDADALAAAIAGGPWSIPPLRTRSVGARRVEAWTAFFSAWSDLALDPWLRSRTTAGEGIHLIDFPTPLAALAERHTDAQDRAVSGRFESHVCGRELANGYRELRDAHEQRTRFAEVAELRAAHGLAALPMPEAFLGALEHPGLPACAGAALGLDRLIALGVGAHDLGAITLAP